MTKKLNINDFASSMTRKEFINKANNEEWCISKYGFTNKKCNEDCESCFKNAIKGIKFKDDIATVLGNEKFHDLTKTMTREEFVNEYQENYCPGEFTLKEDHEFCYSNESNCCQRCWEQAIKNATFKDDVINECTITAEQCTATREYIKADKPSEVAEIDWNDGEVELLEQYKELVSLLVEELEEKDSADFFKYLGKLRPDLFKLT